MTTPEGPPSGEIPDPLPRFYGELAALFQQDNDSSYLPYAMRIETMRRIEKETKRPLLCYATDVASERPEVAIDDYDIIGFGDLVDSVAGDNADVFLISNGGRPEATERIVSRLRGRFKSLRFIVPFNAYSAATLMCFSGDSVLMLPEGTLGPIDPQIDGVPARAILRAFDNLEKRLVEEGAQSLPAYYPLLRKYDLHLLEQCRNAQQLSEELARKWLTNYAAKPQTDNVDIEAIVRFFADWDLHKSHGRSINHTICKSNGIPAELLSGDLEALIRSLHHQYTYFFSMMPFYKVFENAHGIAWGRQRPPTLNVPIPFPILPESTGG